MLDIGFLGICRWN